MYSIAPPELTAVSHWPARWIWTDGDPKPRNCYLMARRSFDLDSDATDAQLHISAADRYVLWINGRYLGRGPARSDPRRKSYDSHDVAAHLKSGRNVIAVQAYHYGIEGSRGTGWGSSSGSSYSVGERAGLWAQLDLTLADGSAQTIGTDSDWVLQPARGWRTDVELINSLVGFIEVYDAGADPADWTELDFDDGDWARAVEITGNDVEWFVFEKREIPQMEERMVYPREVVDVGETIDLGRAGQIDIPELLYSEPHLPLENALAQETSAALEPDGSAATLQSVFAPGQGIRAPFLVVDFGRQLFGYPRLEFDAPAGAILDVTYGQQLLGGRIPAALRYGDRVIAREGRQTWQVGEYRQFRYLHVTVRSRHEPVRLHSIGLNEYRYPADVRGRFECSDEVLTKVWTACVDTMESHIEDTLVCDSYRERVPWSAGDGSHGGRFTHVAWGDLPVVDRYFRLFTLSDRGDGNLMMAFPPSFWPTHVNQHFMLQWSTRIREIYLYGGRRWVLDELYPSVRKQLDWFVPHRDRTTGLLTWVHPLYHIDWTPNDFRGASVITNCLYVASLEDAAALADAVGRDDDAVRWREIAQQVGPTVRDSFWNESRGLFVDAVRDGAQSPVVSELGNSLAVMYGVATPEQTARIADHLASLPDDMVPTSPLFYGYVADALMLAGPRPGGAERLSERYAYMMGASDQPTIWEGWDNFTAGNGIVRDEQMATWATEQRVRPAGVRSLVHSGGVLTGTVLLARILGVMPTGPGFSTCEIRPRPGGLEWARGVHPAPQGDIEVAWQQRNGAFELQVTVPDGVAADVVLPRTDPAQSALVIDGRTTSLEAPPPGVAVSDDVVTIATAAVGDGAHEFQLRAAE